ncbi:3-keto-disaccharide hydrolase [Candidatus Laterigemmans baculatus]|uniref:3-keto-disaccharide hydrolase n=1 Tax=Candidatus Laterigemmans baculatus TaxID=2770505 RepID=UPI0013DCAC98|nr:DUF1080 domain-containing protein [Candidatus Laterigemmans baculatus]
MTRVALFSLAALLLAPPLSAGAAEAEPPEGFRSLFNGENLDGWYGNNPHVTVKAKDAKKSIEEQQAEFKEHWSVENGELVNDGHGPYATTEEEFGDIEFQLEYKTVAKADSGVYLRGTPQVQIWDTTVEGGKTGPPRHAERGSGGLFNNAEDAPGKHPLVHADKPFGEWNQLRIRQVGSRTWVWLNDKLVVDGAEMANFWDRSKPLPERGPIMLQTHGGEIRWRNIFVREIPKDEAAKILSQASAS